MALAIGTNVGFVTTAPTADPNGTAVTSDGSSFVVKDTAPSGAVKIVEVGWYKASGTTSSNTQVGLYAESSGVAATRLQVTGDQASGTSAGWIRFTGLNWSITPGTAYWLGMQQDSHTGTSQIDSASSGGAGIDTRTSQTALTNPYGGGTVSDADGMYAIYAVYQTAPTVALNSPADASSTSDTTPDLAFTGTDAESDDIRYNVQVDTVDTFDSQPSSVDSYSESNSNEDAGFNSTYLKYGQSFTAIAGTLDSAKFYLKKANSPTGNIYAKIYAHTGVYGSSSAPTGAALATSDPIDITTLTTSYQLIEFTFSGAERITLTGGTYYVATVEWTAPDANYNLLMGRDSSSPSHGGNGSYYSGTWWVDNSRDYCFYVYISTGNPLLNKVSGTDAGFSGSPDNTDPFASGQQVTYTVQSALSDDTYYWRVGGLDPSGSNSYGSWSSTRSFTVTSVVYDRTPSVNDTITVSDVPTVLVKNLVPSVSDAITITDVPTVVIRPLRPSVFDAVTVVDAPTVLLPRLVPNVYDSVSVSEDITITIESPPISADINVNDVVAVVDIPAVFLPRLVPSVSDSLTVVDSPTILLPKLYLSVIDSVTVSDVTTVLLPKLYLSVDEQITVVDQPTVFIPKLYINVSDSISIVDEPTMVMGDESGYSISVSDTVSISDSTTVFLPNLFASVSETIEVLESVIVTIRPLYINVSDPITVSEDTTVVPIQDLYINIFDAVAVAEGLTIFPSLVLSISDSVVVSESTSQVIRPLVISVYDGVTITESVGLLVTPLLINVYDGVAIAEGVSATKPHHVSATDTITVSDGGLDFTFDRWRWHDVTRPDSNWTAGSGPTSIWTNVARPESNWSVGSGPTSIWTDCIHPESNWN